MNVSGVIDRIEDEKLAVILAEKQGKEFIVSVHQLPEESKEGTWLSLVIENHKVTAMTIDHDKTKASHNKINSQLNRIQKKSKGSKFKRKS